jgi:hypothetical protein
MTFKHGRLLAAAAALLIAVLVSGASAAPAPTQPAAVPSTPRTCLDSTVCAVPCFGAAARDPWHQPCNNPQLAYAVMPTPSEAELDIGAGCTTKVLTSILWVCDFGPLKATRTFGLVGDSHAGHWRPALATVTTQNDWRAEAITRSGCPFSTAVPALAQPMRSQCIQWNRVVIHWFVTHPEISVVFVSEHAGAHFVFPKGRSEYATEEAGYIAAWAALPASVEHVIVIRDTPLNTGKSFGCVEHALAHHQRPGIACAIPRRSALLSDPAAAAAQRLHSPRVQVIDLTQQLCSPRLCYPVVGGVLVHKDIDHLTNAFAATLGPFLLRQLRTMMAAPGWGV